MSRLFMGIYILNCHDFFVLVVSDINCGLRERNKISEISILFLVSYTEMVFLPSRVGEFPYVNVILFFTVVRNTFR